MRRLLRRLLALTVLTLALTALLVPATLAGSPHFVGTPTVTRSGDSLQISGKEAGLGDEDQVDIVVSATALCINGGGNHPKAVNKGTFSAEGQFPVQNGKAYFSLTLTATFDPPCSPPMTVQWGDVTVTDLTNDISTTIKGPF